MPSLTRMSLILSAGCGVLHLVFVEAESTGRQTCGAAMVRTKILNNMNQHGIDKSAFL